MRSAVPGVAWPAVPDARGASLLAMQWQFSRSQWWPAEELVRHQFGQIVRLVEHACAKVPAYADLAKNGVSARDLDADSFRRSPVLTKAQLRCDPAALHAEEFPSAHGRWHELATTGSTGQPVRVRQTDASIAFGHALVAREHLLHRRNLTRKFGAIRLAAPGANLPGWGVMSTGFETGSGTTIDVLAGVAAQYNWLLSERPAYLLLYPSNLRELIRESMDRGARPSGLEQVLTFGEMLAPDVRDLARSEWGVEVVENYSCREAGTLAFQCPQSGLFHVHAEGVYLEVLRDDGLPAAPGETGRVLITPLHNFAMPLIRYEVGDYAEVGEGCPCGRGLPVLNRIVGRVTNMAVDPTGRRFWPGMRASMLTEVAPFEQLRLVQHATDEVELQYVLGETLDEDGRQRCTRALERMLGYPYKVRFTALRELPRGPGGKFEDFVSLLGAG